MKPSFFFYYLLIMGAALVSCAGAVPIVVDYTDDPVVWNINKPLKVVYVGSFAQTGYDLVLMDGEKKIALTNKKFTVTPTNLTVTANYPPDMPLPVDDGLMLKLTVPSMKSNLYSATLIPDFENPSIKILAMSPAIKKGGSGVVIFEARDANMKTVTIKDNSKKVFYAQPFQADGYYICFIGWHMKQPAYTASIYAEDVAGNLSMLPVGFKTVDFKYPVGKVDLDKTYEKDKTKELGLSETNLQGVDKYKVIQQELAAQSKVNISQLTSLHPKGIIEGFTLKAFKPLLKWRVTSASGKIREYFFEGVKQKESVHMGVDLASEPKDSVYTSNEGVVIFSGYNGGYGNTAVIDHGLGIYTIYSHCTEILVKVGQTVHPGDKIAITGKTGVASGDHLHFGVLVQGVYVNSEEWLNPYWIQTNVTKVIDQAKKLMK